MVATSSSVGSGAAGAAIFADSESRKYRYFEPRAKRATHYEDVTVDVQPDPERYLTQGWIIAFPNGKGAYEKDSTKAQSSNWHAFRAPDQEWERTHYQRQSRIEVMVQSVIANGRKSGAQHAFDAAWGKVLQKHLGAWKHAEFGLGVALMQAQRYGYTQMINNATLTNSSYKLRLSQDITLYLAEIGMDIEGWDDEAGKRAWLEDPARHKVGQNLKYDLHVLANHGITLRGIVTCIRHFGPEKARQTAHCAAETAGDWQSEPARVRAPHRGLSIMGRTLRTCRLATPRLTSLTSLALRVGRYLSRGQALGMPDRRVGTGVKQSQARPRRLAQLVLRLPQLRAHFRGLAKITQLEGHYFE